MLLDGMLEQDAPVGLAFFVLAWLGGTDWKDCEK
jgi:hypothetical protein